MINQATLNEKLNLPLRSLLFTPGSEESMLTKAVQSNADACIFDLEDAVAIEKKKSAREFVRQSIKLHGRSKPLFVRVNSTQSGQILDDLQAILSENLFGIWLPKIESSLQILWIEEQIDKIVEEQKISSLSIPLFVSLETSLGVRDIKEILESSKRVVGVSVGSAKGGDLQAELGGTWDENGAMLNYLRSRIFLYSRAAGIKIIVDGACTSLDESDVRNSTLAAKAIGYRSKMVIHPKHIETIHAVFAPTISEVEHSRRVIEIFRKSELEGKAAIAINGQMIDYAMVANAERILAEFTQLGGIQN
jgi:citrate lyase subunit beta/citryl-CoA lyase